jgi:hypothetical protein
VYDGKKPKKSILIYLWNSKIKETLPRFRLNAGDIAFNLTAGNTISSCVMVLQNTPFTNPCVLECISQGSKKLVEVSLI